LNDGELNGGESNGGEVSAPAAPRSHFITAPDGLRLHVRLWEPQATRGLPVVCLPGLTRTAEDFDDLAAALSGDPRTPRRVLALDYRGRGGSDHDADPKNYNVAMEAADVAAVVAALGAQPAVYVGTSRGGIITMLLAATRPELIAGAVLNDIGPVIETDGLMRIKSYVGRLPEPAGFEDGAAILRRLFGDQFPKLTDSGWLAAARRQWRADGDGRLVLTYDARLRETLESLDPAQPPPDMWEAFEALGRVPVLAIRGELSDLLSGGTLRAMRTRHPSLKAVEVADEGHPVILSGPQMTEQIAAFVARCEAARAG
jgi:pimeloyl-ACP methyl ester carboxylesterase